jgi:putative ABC transport system ATP-binding protein
MALLEIGSLAKRYGDALVFEHVDLAVGAGEFVAILGESGVGKSTLLNCIAGLDSIDGGSVRIAGSEVHALAEPAQAVFRREHLGFVFQAFHVLPHLTVVENVGLPLLLRKVARDEIQARAKNLIAGVGLSGREASLPRELSGGELQRVAIARALVGEPALVLADEPTGNLDPENARQVLALFRSLVREKGAAAILATHSAQAAAGCDRVYRLSGEGLSRVG